MTQKMKSEQTQHKEKKEQQPTGKRNSMNRTLIGGVVGAGIGLLYSPSTGKDFVNRLGQSEVMRVAGNELRRTAQEIVTEQAMMALRQTASGYLSKYEGNLLGLTKGKEDEENAQDDTETEDSSQYKELKEENKNLNDQLQRIEQKLNELLDAKS
ncbi:GvpT/GvpP family gas vesicle accessory protein [Pseudalkalibacillus decolorationis]|uniref:GvpT/GvpP family gas vesicle accessory protein n=1 Tax=Pseudalkalibacillus decolorationis TaxID=163879 RepID=UPI00214806B6|nr:GvpT/GvpP family gas vesicle accessory protein [Pseudalkalibacillus decolorationis]